MSDKDFDGVQSSVANTDKLPRPAKKKDPADEVVAQELAKKTNYLFETYRKPNGERFSYREVAEGTGGAVNPSWVWKMANAQLHSPGIQALKALTDFFGIDAAFWFREIGEEVEATKKFGVGVQTVLARAIDQDFTPEEQQALLGIIEQIINLRKAKGTSDR